jgi:hypothetical protein
MPTISIHISSRAIGILTNSTFIIFSAMLSRSVRTLCISRRAVRSSVFRIVRFRSHLIELDSDENVGATGYDIVMQRAANIVLCNSDRQHFIKVLQLYPESKFVNFLSKVSQHYEYFQK